MKGPLTIDEAVGEDGWKSASGGEGDKSERLHGSKSSSV